MQKNEASLAVLELPVRLSPSVALLVQTSLDIDVSSVTLLVLSLSGDLVNLKVAKERKEEEGQLEIRRRVREKWKSEGGTNGVDLLEGLLDDSDGLSKILLRDDKGRSESDDVDLERTEEEEGRSV